jgi:hypothetical protein
MAAVDARMICPVVDQHGGVVVYERGYPVYYLLGGEWYAAISDTRAAHLASVSDEEREPGSGPTGPEPDSESPGWLGPPCRRQGTFRVRCNTFNTPGTSDDDYGYERTES